MLCVAPAFAVAVETAAAIVGKLAQISLVAINGYRFIFHDRSDMIELRAVSNRLHGAMRLLF